MNIPLNEVLHFDAITSDSSGAAVDADSTPTWAVFEEATDTPIQTGNFTKRTSLDGEYRGVNTLSAGNGYEVGKWYHIKGYALVNAVSGKGIVFNPFRIVPAEVTVGEPKVDVSGANLATADKMLGYFQLALRSDPYISVDRSVELGEINTDEGSGAGGFDNTLAGDVNLTEISGVPVATSNYITDKVWDGVINQHLSGGTYGSGMFKIVQDIFYAGIKFVKDSAGPTDEYAVQWFKNSIPLSSGQVLNPALSVYKTNNGSNLFENKVLNYNSVYHGTLRTNEVSNLATSGEPYLAVTSGYIDGSVRIWKNVIGIDYLL